jgi:hypothetical protein
MPHSPLERAKIASSFMEPLDYDENSSMAVEVYICGLSALQTAAR